MVKDIRRCILGSSPVFR